MAVPSTFAQTTAPAAAYTGPRYPGGPDSLRALVYRSTRLTTPAPTGRVLVQFELKPDGQPQIFQLVPPPRPANRELLKAAATALSYLEARMPAWQPAPPDPTTPAGTDSKISLMLDFTTPQAAQPYCYTDQKPIFATLAEQVQAQHKQFYDRLVADPVRKDLFGSSTKGLTSFVQIQTRYPVEALRNGQEGVVYAYFEVAENGAVEHPEVLGTAGRALDAEVLRIVKTLPAATAPAQLQGRPVRMYYVLPCTFVIQRSRARR